jgi:CheY-like chemotaxis protein
MDGREILRRINGQRPASLRCVLVVSGDVTDSRHHEILGLGADALVAKPVTIDALVALMGELCAAPEAGLELKNSLSARGHVDGPAEDDLQQS